ncbi:DUF2589 domain-containing protein [Aureibacter tunicatorum]|uniref:DUF2589 domain-containing protein n=1 Tax=Aureibacter tunicatorum TaxID=866807 RepID=A0AAE3XHY5_9BACT|nr:DUF2589 domain-containing protein [Aureibacter tunicatorum]MDR6237137.1 hypothetical protein [Aureibacter tunicatorum]BDD06129.1 hypothetical protein AUTU_36120 [Aureibacter tunicatorum]
MSFYEDSAAGLEELFSAPLNAVISADINLSSRIDEFIKTYGFEIGANGEADLGKLRMISFTYTVDGRNRIMRVPALSIIQLPLLQIKEADFDMEVQLSHSLEEVEVLEVPPEGGDPVPVKKKQTKVKGSMAPTQGSSTSKESVNSNMKVKLHMGQADLPGGLMNLMQALNEASHLEEEPDGKLSVSPEMPKIDTTQLSSTGFNQKVYPFSLTITVSYQDMKNNEISDEIVSLQISNALPGVVFSQTELKQTTNAEGIAAFELSGEVFKDEYQQGMAYVKVFVDQDPRIKSNGQIEFIGQPAS